MNCWKCGDTGTWINLHGEEVRCDECRAAVPKFMEGMKETFGKITDCFRVASEHLQGFSNAARCKKCGGTAVAPGGDHYCDCIAGEALRVAERGPVHFNCRCTIAGMEPEALMLGINSSDCDPAKVFEWGILNRKCRALRMVKDVFSE